MVRTKSTPAHTSMSTSSNPIQTPSNRIESPEQNEKQQPLYMKVGPKVFTVSLKTMEEIQYYQTTAHFLIPRAPFVRLVHEIILQHLTAERRIQLRALEALQEAAEGYLVQYFEDSYTCALHAQRSTLLKRDMDLVKHLRDSMGRLQ